MLQLDWSWMRGVSLYGLPFPSVAVRSLFPKQQPEEVDLPGEACDTALKLPSGGARMTVKKGKAGIIGDCTVPVPWYMGSRPIVVCW